MEKILLSISAGIGDALMAQPLLNEIQNNFPQSHIHVLCSAATQHVFRSHPGIQKIWAMDISSIKKYLGLVGKIRKEKFDLYIGAIPSNTYSQLLLPVLAGIPVRIKHHSPHKFPRNLDVLYHALTPIGEGVHRLECNLELLHFLKVNHWSKPSPKFHISDVALAKMKTKIAHDRKKLVIGFHPGCNPAAAFKRWPPERYAALADYLYTTYDATVFIVGGKDEADDVRKIMEQAQHKPLNFAGQCTLEETAALIAQAHFFVSNDSGIMHLSTAVGTPVFAIFGPKDERHIGPYGEKHTVIRNGRDVNQVTLEQVVQTLTASKFGLKPFIKS